MRNRETTIKEKILFGAVMCAVIAAVIGAWKLFEYLYSLIK